MSDGRPFQAFSLPIGYRSPLLWLVVPYSGRDGWMLPRETKPDFLATQETGVGGKTTAIG